VLLVEDNPTDVFVIKEVIKSAGLAVNLKVATNGQEALHYLLDIEARKDVSCPVLILLDLNLPKIDGIEVLRRLRELSRCKQTPVIVVTSSTAEQDRAAVSRLGANAYFRKPKSLAAYKELAQLITRFIPDIEGPPPS
jgi:CheY-like chemotaxis protein